MMKRRKFLLGALGATMALPLLETFSPKRAQAGEGEAESFAIFCRQANGCQQETGDEPDRFWPSFGVGALTNAMLLGDSGRALSELGAFADRLNICRGIRFNFPGNGCGHSGGGNQCLTGAKVSDMPSVNESLAMGESIDNRIQAELGKAGVEPLTLYVGAKYGYLDEVLSYRGPKLLRGAENNPYNVYTDLFGLSNVDPTALEQLRKRRMSVNDLVRDQ